MIRVVKRFPSVRTHAAQGVFQRVEVEAKWLDTCVRPVDNACDVAVGRIDQDVHLIQIAVRKGKWIALGRRPAGNAREENRPDI